MERIKLKNILIIITYTVVLYMALNHFGAITGSLGALFKIVIPFIYGLAIAYVLNIPYEFFRNKVFYTIEKRTKKPIKGLNPLSLVCTYVSVLIAFALIIWFIIPQLGSSVNLLIQNIPSYLASLETLVNKLMTDLNLTSLLGAQTNNTWTDILQKSATMLSSILQGVLNYVLGLTSSIYNWLIGIIFSIYMLIGKETLLRQLKRVMNAFLPKKWVDIIMDVSGRTNYIFNGFIRGSLNDSIVVGILCFLGMNILGIPYAMLVSVIQTLTNLIPVFGPIIGAVPSTFIILMINPVKALVFVIFIIVLQQIDGNIIQPRIVGNTIGLPGIWVLLAIVVGSGLFGIVGLIIGVPVVAVIYGILRESVDKHLEKKEE
ncbi:AI-2E family transporter [Clostridium omnivorum]|uniref:AI-2E family transporter n=1 Tax=Clostridium omnivorum TaxID=1604902 RepID=A0ABQ5NC25_9CLOT|nr:AI-2E family transporter [Clostridium sp. E14]GLC32604.1 AI-2E family transporter [Clostridium sp. E14]